MPEHRSLFSLFSFRLHPCEVVNNIKAKNYQLQVAEILKDWPSWFRDCRAVDVLNVLPTANGGTIELLYMQVICSRPFTFGHDIKPFL